MTFREPLIRAAVRAVRLKAAMAVPPQKRAPSLGAAGPLYRWRVRSRLPERFGTLCRVLVRSSTMNSALVRFESDGFEVVTSRNYIRRVLVQDIKIDPKIVGYYTQAGQTEPVYDPPHDVTCPVCGLPWTVDTVRTFNVMPVEGEDARVASLFYRMHRACSDALTPDEQSAYDVAAIEAGVAAAKAAG